MNSVSGDNDKSDVAADNFVDENLLNTDLGPKIENWTDKVENCLHQFLWSYFNEDWYIS